MWIRILDTPDKRNWTNRFLFIQKIYDCVLNENMGSSLKQIGDEFKQLSKPYYLVNIILCLSFIFCKLVDPICSTLFSHYGIEACELDMRENEILFFLLIVVMMR